MIFFAEASTTEEPRPSALYTAFAGESAANEWTVINGVAAARIYTDIETEYAALTGGAALVDLGVQLRYAVRGYDAAALLGRLTSAPVKDVGVSESARGLILDSDGYVADFCDVTRLSGDSFLITTSGPVDRRLAVAARGFDVSVENISPSVAALGLFGPYAAKTAAAAGFAVAGDALASHGRVRGVEAFARPTVMGLASGVEIIFPAEEALTLWERVRRSGQTIPAGVAACDIVRIEGGAPRPGVDFAPADSPLTDGAKDKGWRRPVEIGALHLAPLNRAWFNGRRAITDAAQERRLITLIADADSVAPGATVFGRAPASSKNSVAEIPVGWVRSAAYSPRYRAAVCFVDLPAEKARPPFTIALDESGAGAKEGMRAKTRTLETPENQAASEFEARGKKPTEPRGFFV